MKTLKITLILVSSILFSKVMVSQASFEIEWSQGFIHTDLIHEIEDTHRDYNLQLELALWKTFDIDKALQPRAGLGYSYLISAKRIHKQYLSLKVGSDFKLNKIIDLTANLSTYFVIKGDNRLEFIEERERRVFLNLDIGLRLKISESTKIRITTPITISPMYSASEIEVINGPDAGNTYNIWVGMVGLNVGASHLFGK